MINKDGSGNIGALLTALANRSLEHYEKGTGLSGVKETFAPLVADTITQTVGNTSIPNEVMNLGGKIFDMLMGLGKMPNMPNSIPLNVTPVQQASVELPKPVISGTHRPLPTKGMPIAGAIFQKGKGRMY